MKLAITSFATLALYGAQMFSIAVADERAILTVDGKTGTGTMMEFTRGELESLGSATIETSTPWHNGVVRFEGVPLQRLMDEVGASGETAYVAALNNYTTEIPLSDFKEHGAILALKADGKYMEVKNKGPLFVIFPFDKNPDLRSEVYYSRSAWQVKSITIE
jgi:hypothetical protein